MSGFDKDAFWSKILSMYDAAKENNYVIKVDEEQIRELKSIFIDLYIPMENLSHYDDEGLLKKMMITISSMYKVDKDTMGNSGEIVQLVNTVNYDGRNMYIWFAKISPVKMRRIQLGKTRSRLPNEWGMGCLR